MAIKRRNDDSLAKAARTFYLVAIAAISVASLAPASLAPHRLYSSHLKHFAIFYVLTALMAAARYRSRLQRIALDVALLAGLLEGIRALNPDNRIGFAQNLVADIGGALGALAAVWIGSFRRSFGDLDEG